MVLRTQLHQSADYLSVRLLSPELEKFFAYAENPAGIRVRACETWVLLRSSDLQYLAKWRRCDHTREQCFEDCYTDHRGPGLIKIPAGRCVAIFSLPLLGFVMEAFHFIFHSRCFGKTTKPSSRFKPRHFKHCSIDRTCTVSSSCHEATKPHRAISI